MTGTPLTQAQLGIWLGDQSSTERSIYNCAELVTFRGRFNPELFVLTLTSVLREAPALHQRFLSVAGVPHAFSYRPETIPIERIDLRHQERQDLIVDSLIEKRLEKPLNLEEGELYSHSLITLSADHHIWLHIAHHIALDGFGFHLLARKICARYLQPAAPLNWGDLNAVRKADAAYENSKQKEEDKEFFHSGPDAKTNGATLHRYRKGITRQNALKPACPIRSRRTYTPQLSKKLLEVARKLDVSWTELNLALFAGFIYRATGRQEFALGVPLMMRLATPSITVPCMAMNIARLVVHVSSDQSLACLAKQIQVRLERQSPHHRFRYEQLKRSDPSRTPFGPVINLIPFGQAPQLIGCKVTSETISSGPVQDISALMIARDDGLEVIFDGHPELYCKDQLERLQHDYQNFIIESLKYPGRSRDEEPPIENYKNALDLIAETALNHGNSLALKEGNSEWSYVDLQKHAKELAQQLKQRGAGPHSLVAILAPRSAAAIIATLAALYCRSAFVHLDPSQPTRRQQVILDHVTPNILVEIQTDVSTLPHTSLQSEELLKVSKGTERLRLSHDVKQWPLAPPHSTPQPLNFPYDTAYLMFTSGSSGEPKGVNISHRSLSSFIEAAQNRYALSREDRVLQFAPLTFDASIEEIFLTLCSGAALILRDDTAISSMSAFAAACQSERISVLDLPTAFFHELSWAIKEGQTQLPPSLHTTIIGGEAAKPEAVAAWQKHSPHCRLINTYGPTEATVVATSTELHPHANSVQSPIPIGRPFSKMGTLIFDQQGALIRGYGTIGELYLYGPQIATDYFGRDDLTQKNFAPLPEHGVPWAYRTGDLVKRTSDGQLHFVGRVDDEVKISGQRISPAEIERALCRHPSVRAALVEGKQEEDRMHLVAHLQIDSVDLLDEHSLKGELRRWLGSRLPATMVPSIWTFHTQFPHTSSRKIDRKALQQHSPHLARRAPLEQHTPLQATIARYWQKVVGGDLPRLDDDFFVTGGQSLQAIQLVNQLNQLKSGLSVVELFQNPTLRKLSQCIENAPSESKPNWQEVPPLAYVEFNDLRRIEDNSCGTILLTGATGHVGSHLLGELLANTEKQVVCLVRAKDDVEARQRIQHALSSRRIKTSALGTRVQFTTNLLLPNKWSDKPLPQLEAVLHCAAEVSLTRDFASLRPSNVDSTVTLLRLAAQTGATFHFVSTLATAPLNGAPIEETFFEAHNGLKDGYQQSKWHAEMLCKEASSLGLPVSIYRLGRVTGARSNPVVNPRDILWRIVRASLRARAWPTMGMKEPWIPADDAAHAIIGLLRRNHSKKPIDDHAQIFNLADNGLVDFERIHLVLSSLGHTLRKYDTNAWLSRVRLRADDEDLATLAFMDLTQTRGASRATLGPIKSGNVEKLLGRCSAAPITQDLLAAYCSAAIEQFTPKTQRSHNSQL